MKFKTWHKIVIGIVLFIVLILFAAPRVARKYIVNHSAEMIGRKVDIGKLRINYFSGAVRISDVLMYEQDELTQFVSFKKLLVNLDYWPLFKNELLISKISLADFYCNIEQEGDQFNFSELLASEDSAQVQTEQIDSTLSDPMILTFNNITISNSQAHYTDILLDHTISLNDINLYIPGFSLNTGSTNLELDFEFSQGGGLHSALTLNQNDGAYALDLSLDSLNVDIIEPYIKNVIMVNEVNGFFSNSIELKGNLEHIMQIEMKGWNKIEGLEILDQQDRSVLSFDNFNIDIDTLILDQNEIKINEIVLSNPYILFELIDSTNNWSAMMIPADSVEQEAAEVDTLQVPNEEGAEKPVFKYSLERLELQNGLVNFRDFTLNEDFEAQLRQINISSKDITGTSTEVIINLSAKLNETAQISSEAAMNLLDMQDIDIDFSLNQFSMEDIEPYLMTYFGYPVEGGLLNLSTSNDLKANSISSINKLHIKNFNLGKADKDSARMKLPLKLVVGILSDREGVIELDIPVEIKDEKTSIANLGKIIFKIFGNLIVKAATSPIDFLANLYGADPESLQALEIGIFDHLLSQNSIGTLDLIASILNDKPQLAVELKYGIDEEKYYDSLATQLTVGEYMETLTARQYTHGDQIPDSALVSYLSKKNNSETFDPKEDLSGLCVSYIGSELLSERLDSTKSEHYRIVHDYLITQKMLEQDKVKIIMGPGKSTSSNSEYATFKIDIKSRDDE